jgi:hypothetical protein
MARSTEFAFDSLDFERDQRVMKYERMFETENYFDVRRATQQNLTSQQKPKIRAPSDFLKDWAKKNGQHLQFERISPVHEK